MSDLSTETATLDEPVPASDSASHEAADELRQMARSRANRYAIAVVVVSGVLLTFLFAVISMASSRSARDDRFSIAALAVVDEINDRYDDYLGALTGLRGHVASGGALNRAGFDGYVEGAGLTDLPGVIAVGFAPLVPASDVDELEDEIRDEGFEDFEVSPQPEGGGDVFPVVYVQPLGDGTENTFGFDLGADERGREAIDQAVRGGEATLGPPLVVMNEEGESRPAANLYLPVYSGGVVPDNEELRRDRLEGVAFILLDVQAALSDLFVDDNKETRAEIYDLGGLDAAPGVEPNDGNLLFDSDGDPVAIGGSSGLDQRISDVVGSRQWLFYVQPGPGFDGSGGEVPWIVILTGLAITGLIAALIISFAQTRKQAVSLADEMTAYLQQRERELSRANDDIVRSNKELERYASIAAHDLQEPLRSLLAYASVLERRYGDDLDPDVLDQVQRMARAAERMRSLVVDLLAYAKADSARRKIEWVDLNEAIRIAIDDLSVLIHETGATIRVADLPRVPGNRRELIGVFSNLLSNALKYRGEAAPEVIVVAHERGGEWVIGVKDNGIGIDPSYHDRIFELFRRLEKRSSDSGTGLGLAICARTIAQHGGKIWVESIEGEGATFWFTLPAEARVSEVDLLS
jgi:signal transduction histidine kinase